MSSPEPVIRTDGLTKRFGHINAVDDLDFEVDAGGVFGYLGPNGAGKTTTIRMLLGFLQPTSGSAEVLGGSGSDPAIRARIGYLPGELRLDPHHTTRDIVDFFGSIRGGDQPHVEELLERFDLDPDRPVGDLSTGNRRKVGITQAFMNRPELLILDEPTSGLDPLLQHEFQILVRERVADGATVFLSSHALPEVEALAHRVAILRGGRLLTVATIDELRARARQRIELHVADPVDADPVDVADFASVDGVAEATVHDGVVRLVVEGSADAVIKAASRFDVVRIVAEPPDLDEVFLNLYAGNDT
jgi:ABC-2 type transport system ATP-binding protein